ncbi:MAG: hypothetical protein ACTSRK_20810, partial [Promethearchaeota archaeon]
DYPEGPIDMEEPAEEEFNFETADQVEEPPTKSKNKSNSNASRVVDPLEAVERALAGSESKLKGSNTKKVKLKKKTVDAATEQLYSDYEGKTGKKAFWNGKETNGYLEWRQATA